jgi:DNA-binding response OmpR family regulator
MPQRERDRIVVVSRDPRLADVRKRVLENAGFAVIAASDASIIEQACGHERVRLIMLGHSLSPADKRHVWAAAKAHCRVPILELHRGSDPELLEQNVIGHESHLDDDFINSVRKILTKQRTGD